MSRDFDGDGPATAPGMWRTILRPWRCVRPNHGIHEGLPFPNRRHRTVGFVPDPRPARGRCEAGGSRSSVAFCVGAAPRRVVDRFTGKGWLGTRCLGRSCWRGTSHNARLSLSDADRDWAARNCRAFMHNAASLTFHSEAPDGEPWRSNVHGVRNVLDFCQSSGIREFHQVSTAYVCGLREGSCLRKPTRRRPDPRERLRNQQMPIGSRWFAIASFSTM